MLPGFDGVVDISHHQTTVDFEEMYHHGVRAVILKASQGQNSIDNTFQKRAQTAAEAGMLVGAYHFGENSDAQKQLENFLNAIHGSAARLFAFDFEQWTEVNASGEKIVHAPPTVGQAIEFLDRLENLTGRLPLLYGGHSIREALTARPNPYLSRFPLWLADYRGTPQLPKGWHAWTFWQYTDGTSGPNAGATPGVGHCDRSVFAGTEEQLTALWHVGQMVIS